MPRVLIIGGAGLLGQYACDEAHRRGYEIIATTRGAAPKRPGVTWRELDVRDRDAIRAVVRESAASVVLNAAALTDVDGCEDRPE